MRRAFCALALVALVTASCAAIASAIQIKYANRIDAIGLVDYSRPPKFKVGDYVRYRVTNNTAGADRSTYILTLLIAGEENFWGEKGFWLETWTDEPGKIESVASLMSYDIFNDSLADERIQIYRRKISNGIDEHGNLAEELTRGNSNLNSVRTAPARPSGWQADTMGVDTVLTPLGLLRGRRVNITTGKQLTRSEGDSTIYLESRDTRSRWIAGEIPITHLAREDSRSSSGRRAWRIGFSSESAPMLVKEDGSLTARVIETGHGLKPRLIPPDRARSVEQQAMAAKAPTHRSSAPRRPAGAAHH